MLCKHGEIEKFCYVRNGLASSVLYDVIRDGAEDATLFECLESLLCFRKNEITTDDWHRLWGGRNKCWVVAALKKVTGNMKMEYPNTNPLAEKQHDILFQLWHTAVIARVVSCAS